MGRSRAAASTIAALAVSAALAGACSSSSSDDTAPGGGGGGTDGGGPGEGGAPGDDGGSLDGGSGGGDAAPDGASEGGGGGDGGARCSGVPATCGGANDCCASGVVAGGSYARSNDPTYPATISDFRLDVYEVTVGRFRAFVAAGQGTQAIPPAAGDGAHPKIASSGWDAAWNAELSATTADLVSALKCTTPHGPYATWTDAPSADDNRPINCVSWFEAFAFCAWDGGRLPTEAEWNYAAAGGSDQRDYPWGATIDHTRASYACAGDGSGEGVCAATDIRPVGSYSPAGDGKWGQADLAGNLWEWTLDWSAVPYRISPCVDCADLLPAASGYRTFRGGGFLNEYYYQLTSERLENTPARQDDLGFRCARAVTPP